MDRAFWGSARWGYFRWTVYIIKWDRLLNTVPQVSPRIMGGIDPFITGSWRTDHVRTGVYVPLFDELMVTQKQVV